MNIVLPRVSVALCVHNGARWLREQLDSVLAQEDVLLEVVALDENGNPSFATVLKVARAIGVKFHAEVA